MAEASDLGEKDSINEADNMALMFGGFWDQMMKDNNLEDWMLGACVPKRNALQEALAEAESEEESVECDTSEKGSPSGCSDVEDNLDITDSDASTPASHEEHWTVEETVVDETDSSEKTSDSPPASPVPETQEPAGVKRKHEGDEEISAKQARAAEIEKAEAVDEDLDKSNEIWLD